MQCNSTNGKKLRLKKYCGNDGSLEAFLACKLITIDKNPGVTPTGIGEVIRRILGRAVMTNFRRNIPESAGNLQLRAGQRAGCEATAHALSSIFSQHGSDAILLVDADNGFNWLKRIVTLHNIRIICLVIATYIINLHSQEVRFFISEGEEIASAEGKIQGDPAAVPIYALRFLLLLNITIKGNTKYAAYPDDMSYVGKLRSILTWWNKQNTSGPKWDIFQRQTNHS